jgi:hypothetical protein
MRMAPFRAGSSDAFGGRAHGAEDTSVPGTGTHGGIGFRDHSKRVVVLITENDLRDAAYGHDVLHGTCFGVPSRAEAGGALAGIDAKLVSINAYESQDIDHTLQEQLEDLADTTGSRMDADGDGARDDRAVFSGDWDWPGTDRILRGIWDVIGG